MLPDAYFSIVNDPSGAVERLKLTGCRLIQFAYAASVSPGCDQQHTTRCSHLNHSIAVIPRPDGIRDSRSNLNERFADEDVIRREFQIQIFWDGNAVAAIVDFDIG